MEFAVGITKLRKWDTFGNAPGKEMINMDSKMKQISLLGLFKMRKEGQCHIASLTDDSVELRWSYCWYRLWIAGVGIHAQQTDRRLD